MGPVSTLLAERTTLRLSSLDRLLVQGLASREFKDRSCSSWSGGVSPPDILGGYGQVGTRPSGDSPNLRDVEGGISLGFPGWTAGKTRTYDGQYCPGTPGPLPFS